MRKGTRVRLVGKAWREEWRGLTGTVTDDDYVGVFEVTVDEPPMSALFNRPAGPVMADASEVEVIA
jgi:hypothetical protein